MNQHHTSHAYVAAALSAIVLLLTGCSDERLDPGDGGATTDASDFDASPPTDPDACACTLQGGFGWQSMPCYCALEDGRCFSYDVLLGSCTSPLPPDFNRIEVHAACNLIMVTTGGGFGGRWYVYDMTSHELVGGRSSMDTNSWFCGTDRVFGFIGGTLPPTDCPISETRPLCPSNGGANHQANE